MEQTYQIPSKSCTGEQRLKFWLQVIADQKASGLNVTKFCKQHQISFTTFQYWKYKRLNSRKATKQRAKDAHFVPLQLSGSPINNNSVEDITAMQNKKIEILFKNGHKIIFPPHIIDLLSLVKTLEKTQC